MELWRFIFPFLYTRDWHTGEYELSRPRTALFCGMTFLIVLGIGIVALLQMPIEYTQYSTSL